MRYRKIKPNEFFVPGDRVRCVSAVDDLIVGAEYTIREFHDTDFINLDRTGANGFYWWRFVLADTGEWLDKNGVYREAYEYQQ